MQTWIVTGVSGSGRIELLEELKAHCDKLGMPTQVHDVGGMLAEEVKREKLHFADDKILDVDVHLLRALRAAVVKEVRARICEHADAALHLIGIHATFRWKQRLIPGVSFTDVCDLKPCGLINVVDNVNTIRDRNANNPKWDANTLPDLEATQNWMIEEEFLTEVLGEVLGAPMYLVARSHNISNLADLFFTRKKKIYLSYPMTAVEDKQPELIEQIQGEILSQLQELFIVFNPRAIEDMPLVNDNGLPRSVKEVTSEAKALIKSRTVERDFQFIDQSDAVVVYYTTEKVSAGVLAEIYYAHRNMKPVFVFFPYKLSPFLEGAATAISKTPQEQMDVLREFANIEIVGSGRVAQSG